MTQIKLNTRPFQETLHQNICGAAALKIVFDYYGVEKTEQELADLCGIKGQLGVGSEGLKKVAESFGFNVEIKNETKYSDIENYLQKGIPVIVDWFSRGRNDYSESEVADGHYSVVTGIDEENIYLQDPEIGKVRKMSRDDFYRVWFDFSGNNIEKWEDLIIRQIIAIYK